MEQTCEKDKCWQSQPDSLNHVYSDKHPKLLGFQRCPNIKFMLDAEQCYLWKINLASIVE